MELWRLLAHEHYFTISFQRHELRLCARCSGYAVGYISSWLFLAQALTSVALLEPFQQVVVCLAFVVPLSADWMTQTWGLRFSNNPLRFVTGYVMGMGLLLLIDSSLPFGSKAILSLSTALAVLTAGVVGRRLRSSDTQG